MHPADGRLVYLSSYPILIGAKIFKSFTIEPGKLQEIAFINLCLATKTYGSSQGDVNSIAK